MVSWEKHPEIIDGIDPSHLATVLDELSESEGWKWLIRCLSKQADVHWKMIRNTVESNREQDGFNFQTQLDENRNKITAKTLECVTEIVDAAKGFCLSKMRKTENR